MQPQRRTLQFIAATRPEDMPPTIVGALPRLEAQRAGPSPSPTPTVSELLKARGDIIPPTEFATPKRVADAMLHAASPRGLMSGTRMVGFADVIQEEKPDEVCCDLMSM